MKQIEDLQGRILAAMERIGAGVSALEAAQAAAEASAPDTALAEALEEEKLANAQLEERLKVLHARLEEAEQSAQGGGGDMAAMQAELELLRNEVGDPAEKEALKAEVARLKGELEAAGNHAASDKEALEEQLAELQAQNEALRSDQPAAGDGGAAAMAAEIESLRAELEEARAAAADGGSADAGAELQRQNEMLVRLDEELQQLRLANEQLRASNAALREANAEGVGDASLINAAMEAEIEGLRAAQASDQAQVNAVLAKLEPLLANARNLPEGEEV